MQFNTFELGEELKLSFNLNISGTSAQPSEVRVVLGNGLKLQTLARLGNGGEYEATLPILPDLFSQGDTTLLIEVVVNGKLFTPVKQRVTIIGTTISVNAQTAIPTPVVQEPIPAEEPVQQPVIVSGKFISQAELLAKAGIKSESVKTVKAPIKEEVKKPKVVKEAKKPIEPTKLQFDLTDFANFYEPVEKPVIEEQKPVKEELTQVKVSTGNFRIHKTKIVTR